MTTTTRETEITVDPKVPLVRITREFDASPEKVFRAHTDPDLVAQWLGPRRHEMRIDHFDCRTGGSPPDPPGGGGHQFRVPRCFPHPPPAGPVRPTLTLRGLPPRGAPRPPG